MSIDPAELDKALRQIVAGCPYGPQCEPSCPMDVIRWQRDPQATLRKLAEKNRVELYQIHLLCPRHRCADHDS